MQVRRAVIGLCFVFVVSRWFVPVKPRCNKGGRHFRLRRIPRVGFGRLSLVWVENQIEIVSSLDLLLIG